MKTIYIILCLVLIILIIILLYLYKYNKIMLEKFILILMKITEKILATSGKNKFDLVIDVIMYVINSISAIIPLSISRETIEETAQKIYDENRQKINECKEIVAMYNMNKTKDVIKNIKEEVCEEKK